MKQGVPFGKRIITLTKYKDLFQKVKFMLAGNTTQNKDTKKESIFNFPGIRKKKRNIPCAKISSKHNSVAPKTSVDVSI